MEAGLRVHDGGSGEPVLLLLHGLGATGDVWEGWRPLLAERWPRRWLAPDLPGHGGSPPLDTYTFDTLAVAITGLVDPGTRTVVLGHSLGGVVGLALASSDFPLSVQAVIGLGIKVVWTGEELDRTQALAQRTPAWYDSRDEAAARYLRVSGLVGLVSAEDPAVDAGLREQNGRWQLVMDPAAFAIGAPDMAQLLSPIPGSGDPGPRRARPNEHRRAAFPAWRPHGHAPRPGPQRTRPEPATLDRPPGPVSMTPVGRNQSARQTSPVPSDP